MSFAAFEEPPANGADAFNNGDDVDPAADFLARQQDEMADLEEDGTAKEPETNGETENEFTGDFVEVERAEADDINSGLAEEMEGVGINGGTNGTNGSDSNGFAQQTSNGGEMLDQGFGGDEMNDEDEPSDLYSAMREADRMAKEPENIKKWREEFSKRIADKDELEEKRRVDLKEAAAKELVDWQRHYEEQMKKQKATNREAEAEFIKQRDEETPGSEWERVAWLCDFNPKTSKQTKDVSRMRSLLLQMKQQ